MVYKIQGDITQLTEHTYTTDSVKIVFDVYYKKGGTQSNSPIAILIHGFSANRKTMKAMALEFAKNGFISVALDLRGHGDSEGYLPGWPNNTTKLLRYKYFELDINSVVKYLEVHHIGNTSEIMMVGHSMGGATVLYYASKHSNVIATVSIAPGIVPSGTVNTSYPKNLLLITSIKDKLVPLNYVLGLLNKATGQESEPNKLYNISGNLRMLYLDKDASHMSETLDKDIINATISWGCMIARFGNSSLHGVTQILRLGSLISLFTGVILLLSTLPILVRSWGIETKIVGGVNDYRFLIFGGILIIAIGSLIAGVLSVLFAYLFLLLTKLVIADIMLALLLSTSLAQYIIFIYIQRRYKEKKVSLKGLLKKVFSREDYHVMLDLAIIYSFALIAILYITIGNNITLTFTTSITHLIYLPTAMVILFFASLLDEIVLHVYVKPRFESKLKMVSAATTYFIVVKASILAGTLAVFSIITHSSFFFLLIGYWLLLPIITITALNSEVTRESTGNILTQVLVNTIILSTFIVTYTPAISF